MERKFKLMNGELIDWGQFAYLLEGYCKKHSEWYRHTRRSHDIAAVALSDVLLDLLDRWQGYHGSINPDDTLNVGYALRFGRSRFARYYFRELQGRTASEENIHSMNEDFLGSYDPALTLEELEVYEFLKDQSPADVRDWFKNFDGSPVEQARREGISRQAVHQRRATRKRAMKASWDAWRTS